MRSSVHIYGRESSAIPAPSQDAPMKSNGESIYTMLKPPRCNDVTAKIDQIGDQPVPQTAGPRGARSGQDREGENSCNPQRGTKQPVRAPEMPSLPVANGVRKKVQEPPPSTAPSQPSYNDKLKKLQGQIARLQQQDREKSKEIEALQLELRAAKMREDVLRKRAESAPKPTRLAPLNETLRSHQIPPGVLQPDDAAPSSQATLQRRSSTNTFVKPKPVAPTQKRPVRELARAPQTPPTLCSPIKVQYEQLEACSSAGVITLDQVDALWNMFVRVPSEDIVSYSGSDS